MSHHLTPSDKLHRLERAAVSGITAGDTEIKFTIKQPVPLPLDTVSPQKSARELENLLGAKEGVSVTQGQNGYDVVLTGAAKDAFGALQAAAAAARSAAQHQR